MTALVTRGEMTPEVSGARDASPSSHGLSSREASARLEVDGPNEPFVVRRDAVIVQIGRRFANPLLAILLFASVASAALGDIANASIIFAMVILSVGVEFVQTRRSERAADALKASVAQTARVRRDGAWREIPRREIVRDDVIQLDAGDMVPADALLLEAKDLHAQEAALTGESLPVEKDVGTDVLMGSSIVSGNGVACVTKTGTRTAFGMIASRLATRPPPSEFEHGVTRFGVFIMKMVFFLVLFVFAVTALLHRAPLESLLFAVSLAVGLTPEFLPMITTITLTKGAVRMARSKVIVKNLAAIQNFGSIDVLCSDKTGTITRGEMTLERHVDPRGATSERPLLLAYMNSYFESGVDNPVDEAVRRHAKVDALDSAVLRHPHPDISGFAKVDEIPFDFERRRVSVVASRGDTRLIVTKGAPESVLGVCASYEVDGEARALDDDSRARIESTFRALSNEGHRALAVASVRADKREGFDKNDERDMIFAGFVTFADPPREDAKETIAALREQGITVKVLTGDSELVAANICARVGISAEHVLLGSEIEGMTNPALAQRVEMTHVFARVSPSQKERILRAIKSRGHVVGFLGDGINDAPSLHAADVGISVSGAVDVAREAADIILLDPDLRVLLDGVIEGRKAFGNVMKYLLMGTSSNFGNVLSMAAAAAVLPFLPMLPTQILLNNFLYDVAQITIPSDKVDASLTRAPRKWDIALIRKFMLWIGPVSSLYDFLTFWILLRVLRASEAEFHTGWFVESLATQTLVIFVIRTMGSPFKSRPSPALAATAIGVVALGIALPFLPIAHSLGFTPLPPLFFGFLALAVVTYLGLVEVVKRLVMRRAFA